MKLQYHLEDGSFDRPFLLLSAQIVACRDFSLDSIAKIWYNYNVYLCKFVNSLKFDDLIN